jgi:hypothetical protein
MPAALEEEAQPFQRCSGVNDTRAGEEAFVDVGLFGCHNAESPGLL